jgi:hypothetical protein
VLCFGGGALAKSTPDVVVCFKTCTGFSDTFSSDDFFSSYVDIYNSTSNSWIRLPEGLGQSRCALVAASLSSGLVFFAGGRTSGSRRSRFAFCLPRVFCAVVLYRLCTSFCSMLLRMLYFRQGLGLR